MDTIEKDCLRMSETITWRILQEWIAGKGMAVTWESLVRVLRDTELSTLADQIEAEKLRTV